MGYAGGKSGSGVYQKIIAEIPPHGCYIETHLGGGGVFLKKKKADRSIGIDLNRDVISGWVSEARDLGLELYCMDAVDFLRSFDFGNYGGNVFLYVDPPYVMSTRKGGKIYKKEYTDKDHVRLLECLMNLPCNIMISGYRSELYDLYLKGWRSIDFRAMTRRGLATETIWMNYATVDVLHDYSFVGDTFRDRERLKRKRDRWVKRLQGMDARERNMLLECLSDLKASNMAMLDPG